MVLRNFPRFCLSVTFNIGRDDPPLPPVLVLAPSSYVLELFHALLDGVHTDIGLHLGWAGAVFVDDL